MMEQQTSVAFSNEARRASGGPVGRGVWLITRGFNNLVINYCFGSSIAVKSVILLL